MSTPIFLSSTKIVDIGFAEAVIGHIRYTLSTTQPD